MTTDVETVVVGAGVVGLAIARALLACGHEVMVLERHERAGTEVSSRNSEVVHAGLYYPPGSLRARMCVEGRERLYRFAAEHGVAVHRLGKLLVATSAAEVPRLEAIAATAAANGVGDLQRLSQAEARALEPHLACVAALLSPSTGVIDSHGLLTALEGEIGARGGQIVLRAPVAAVAPRSGGGFRLTVAGDGGESHLDCTRLVLAAGLGGTALAQTLPSPRAGYTPPRTYPAKGHYFTLQGVPRPFSRLVYPMPDGAWLGVHVTIDVAGRMRFGPDVEWIEAVDYAFDDADGARRARFEREVRRYWPGLPDGALVPDTTGIRPKIYPEGAPAADFAIHDARMHGHQGLVALYGIESPGLTSALAIGAWVADQLGTQTR